MINFRYSKSHNVLDLVTKYVLKFSKIVKVIFNEIENIVLHRTMYVIILLCILLLFKIEYVITCVGSNNYYIFQHLSTGIYIW